MTETESAFMQLVRPCWDRLHVVARHRTDGLESARDMVQETLCRAWRAFRPGDARTYREGWLFVIQHRIAAEWARRADRRIRLAVLDADELTERVGTELTDPLDALPFSTESQFREFLDGQVAAAFDSLPSVYRETLLLSIVADLNYREMAEVLDCPVGTVMSRVARARRALRERLCHRAGGLKSAPERSAEAETRHDLR